MKRLACILMLVGSMMATVTAAQTVQIDAVQATPSTPLVTASPTTPASIVLTTTTSATTPATTLTPPLETTPAIAVPPEFIDARQEALYRALLDELRCLVCPNQNLADSNAPLAKDLRGKVAAMVMRGQSREEVVDYLTDRYGAFVLYRPRLNAANFLLWCAPLFVLLIGLATVGVLARRKPRAVGAVDADARQRARVLLAGVRGDGESDSESDGKSKSNSNDNGNDR